MPRRIQLAALASLAALAAAGCVAVKPWQREALASPAMESPWGEPVLASPYRAKVVESRTGGSLPAGSVQGGPGGGCGCTQ